jgi:membrane protein YdbS with pleckstrin-like domain
VDFPRKLLAPGEEVVVETTPNWSVLARPFSVTLVLIVACVAIVVWWTTAPVAVLYVIGLVALLAVAWFAAKLISWRSRLLVITTTRVVYRSGVIRRVGREIPLDRVQDVTYRQTLLERLAGAGSLTIESAGASGQEPFPDVRHPAEMQSLINQLITGDREPWRRAAEVRRSGAPVARQVDPLTAEVPAVPPAPPVWSAPAVPPAPAPRVPSPDERLSAAGGQLGEQLRDLERLHELGVITNEEFDKARRELLGLA